METISTKVLDTWTKRNTDGIVSRVRVYSNNTKDEFSEIDLLNKFIRTIHPNKKFTIQIACEQIKGKWKLMKNTYDIYYPNRIITGPCVI